MQYVRPSMDNLSLAFFHDSRFSYDEAGIYYTAGSLTSTLLEERYLSVFNRMTVVARATKRSGDIRTNLSIASHKNIRFRCLARLNLISLLGGNDRKVIRESVLKADFCIIRLPSIIGIIAFFEAKKAKKPFIIEMVGCPYDALWNYGKWSYKLIGIILYLINRLVIYYSPYVIYVTQSFLQKRYPTKGVSIGCSDVNVKELRNTADLNRPKKFLPHKKFTIGTIANVEVKYKGHRYVIEAMSRLKQCGYNNIEYQLVGGGDPSYLQAIADNLGVGDCITFVGVLKHEDIFNWLDNVDVYAQLSLQEGLPRAVVEAMSRGCVCIVSNTGGMAELVSSNFLVPRKDSKVFECIVERLINDRHFLLAESVKNIIRAESYLSEGLDYRRTQFMIDVLSESITKEEN